MPAMPQATTPANERTERNAHRDFVQRGKKAIARSIQAGDWIPAEVVIAKLEAKLAAERERMPIQEGRFDDGAFMQDDAAQPTRFRTPPFPSP